MTLALKHGDRQDIARHMARWMVTSGDKLFTPETCLVPVPLHWTRMLRRRFNQSVLIANAIANPPPGPPTSPMPCKRTRATKPQKDMTRAERFKNQRDAIQAHPARTDLIRDKPILLIDDVMTTGATLSACAEACLAAGAASVNILVFARVARAGLTDYITWQLNRIATMKQVEIYTTPICGFCSAAQTSAELQKRAICRKPM